ncbi:MAG: Endoribonuclease L-PSP [Candidatus Omnitrophica bacterium ADurb.Bin277]|nr:MAG: Endoribonuclease L-PSP [Candidatus Omnitrophica bacterium ADurb.Bin277]
MNIESKLKELGLKLPPASKPVGVYQPFTVSGKLVFLSGQLSKDQGGKVLAGKVGKDLTAEEGRKAAELAVLNALSVMHHLIGVKKIARVLKVTGFVQTSPDFYEIPSVLNRASEILCEVFGEAGVHARSAVGMASLPFNAAVEIELILELE